MLHCFYSRKFIFNLSVPSYHSLSLFLLILTVLWMCIFLPYLLASGLDFILFLFSCCSRSSTLFSSYNFYFLRFFHYYPFFYISPNSHKYNLYSRIRIWYMCTLCSKYWIESGGFPFMQGLFFNWNIQALIVCKVKSLTGAECVSYIRKQTI